MSNHLQAQAIFNHSCWPTISNHTYQVPVVSKLFLPSLVISDARWCIVCGCMWRIFNNSDEHPCVKWKYIIPHPIVYNHQLTKNQPSIDPYKPWNDRHELPISAWLSTDMSSLAAVDVRGKAAFQLFVSPLQVAVSFTTKIAKIESRVGGWIRCSLVIGQPTPGSIYAEMIFNDGW